MNPHTLQIPRMCHLSSPVSRPPYPAQNRHISPGPSIKHSHFQNFVLRHIAVYPSRLTRRCPISRRCPHVHARRSFLKNFSQKFWPLSQVAPHSPAEFAPSRIFPQNPAKTSVMFKARKTGFMLPSEEIFPKNFFQKIQSPQLPLSYIPQKFFQKIFSKIFGFLRHPADGFVRET